MIDKNWRKRTLCLASAAALLAAGAGSGRAMAYFTTYALASGGATLALGVPQTDIDEDVVDGEKQVNIQNVGEYDCYVRLRAFAGGEYPLTYTYSQNWEQGADGYFYYRPVLAPGGTTDQFNIRISALKEEITEDRTLPTDFNVIVVQEYTPVLYDDDGNPYADWNMTEESVTVPVQEEREGE